MNVGNVRKVAILFLAQILATRPSVRVFDLVALGAKRLEKLRHPGPNLSRQGAGKLSLTTNSDRCRATIRKVVVWQF